MSTQVQVQHKFHHDDRPYAVANKEAADKARDKLTSRFNKGSIALKSAVESLETHIPVDALVPHNKVAFDFSEQKLQVILGTSKKPTACAVHPHAYGQLLEKADIPRKYGDRLLLEDPSLLAHNLLQRYKKKEEQTYLARVVSGQLRGWLSDSYAIYDTQPMVESFIQTCAEYKAVPVEAQNLDTRFYLKMMIPIVFEPIPNEVLAFGIQFRTSDFGDGAYEVRGFLSRVWCTNDAMTEESLRQVHLGPRLTADNFSRETLKKQAEMLTSATRDTVRGILKPQNIERNLKIIKDADEQQIPIAKTLESMRKTGELTKAESDRVSDLLATSDVEILPPVRTLPKKGHTSLWRLANTFSWIAHEEDTDRRRAMDLETLSGKLLGLNTKNKAAEG